MNGTTILWSMALFLSAITIAEANQSRTSKPNIIVIISDDAGHADFSLHGSKTFRTPHIDSLAKGGVHCSTGYVSASVCSPSRAGLMTGRYQQRFGHEFNIPPKYSETNGLPVNEQTIADLMKAAGYRTIALGKWHLGYAPHFHPLSRGFDDYFGFLQGARSYWPIKGTKLNQLLRDRKPIPEKFTYMTDELGKQAARYIAENRKRPFFLYLSFNAVHTPMHAKEQDLKQFQQLKNVSRQKLAAMTKALDDAVGTVMAALDEHNLRDNTLVIFINDNGGAQSNSSNNLPLRGWKGTPFEGGLRVPFIMRWPDRLPAGNRYPHPVISLDILPTALAAAGATKMPKKKLDGVNLLPYLTGKKVDRPHRTLHWRKGPNFAVRDGDWKLLRHKNEMMLFDLAKDPRESVNLIEKESERANALLKTYKTWEAELMDPRWNSKRKKKKKGKKMSAMFYDSEIKKREFHGQQWRSPFLFREKILLSTM